MKFTFWAQVASIQNKVKNTPAKKTWYFLEILFSFLCQIPTGRVPQKGSLFSKSFEHKALTFSRTRCFPRQSQYCIFVLLILLSKDEYTHLFYCIHLISIRCHFNYSNTNWLTNRLLWRFLSESSQAHHISAVSVYLIYLFSLLTVQMCALYVHMC